jgi:hypothetical protein
MLIVADDVRVPVSFVGMSPQINHANLVADQAFGEYGHDAVITSLSEGKHTDGSLHYIGHAVDYRTLGMSQSLKETIRSNMARRLGREWDVVLSDKNLHVEWQPKRGVNLE